MAARTIAAVLAAALGGAGCSKIHTRVHAAEPRQAPGVLLAGAARVDITPPPGYPMGGHGFAGTESRGTWGRLHARALVLEDPRGTPFALVVGDLWSVSAGLTDAVVMRLQRDHDLGNFDRGSLILAATHTHQSPGGFASDLAHNAAAADHPTYDRRLFDALAAAIARAVAEAYARRRPARLEVVDAILPGLSRNRSLPAFRRDPEAPAWIAETPAPGACAGPIGTDADACRAIDPGAAALRLHGRDDGALIGAAIFVALHPTAMPNRTPVYQSDVFGIAASRLEAELAGEGDGGPVIAVINGAEGDVSPAWRAQGLGEALRIAGLLGDGIRHLVGTPAAPVEVASIRGRHGVFALADRDFVDPAGTRRRTARRATLGWVALGGAEDGPTGARVPPEGSTRAPPRGDHGAKRPLVAVSESILPSEAPLAVIRFGGHVLAALPGEVTTILGARVRAAVAAAAAVPPGRVHLVGLAGAYRSYFTTPEEYAAQHYEGASSLYGPNGGMLLVHDLACLAAPRGRCDDLPVPEDRVFRPGPTTPIPIVDRRRGRRFFAKGGAAADTIFRRPGVTPLDLRFRGPALARGVVALGDAVWPEVTVEVAGAGGWSPWIGPRGRERAVGHRVVLRVVSQASDGVAWEARWIDPTVLPAGLRARLRVTFEGRELGCSPPFERGAVIGGDARVVEAIACE